MKKPKIFFLTLSPVKEDGSRQTIAKKQIATFENEGDAFNVKHLLEKYTYHEALNQHSDFTVKYALTVER